MGQIIIFLAILRWQYTADIFLFCRTVSPNAVEIGSGPNSFARKDAETFPCLSENFGLLANGDELWELFEPLRAGRFKNGPCKTIIKQLVDKFNREAVSVIDDVGKQEMTRYLTVSHGMK